MRFYNKAKSDEVFEKAKRLLDANRYQEAIHVFDQLITYAEDFKDNPDAILTLVVSLNNRGLAQCKFGLSLTDKNLLLKGIADFNHSISFTENDDDKIGLTAYSNLKWFEKEATKFEKPEDDADNVFPTN